MHPSTFVPKGLNNKTFAPSWGATYISFEGPEGVGKTTFVTYMRERLTKELGHTAVVRQIKEPGQTLGGGILRQRLLSEKQDLDTEMQLFLADRILTQQLLIKPALERGEGILSDRSVVSSLVYQGLMNDRFDEVMRLHTNVPDFIYPQFVIIGQCPVDVALARYEQRKSVLPPIGTPSVDVSNHFDEAPRDYHQRMHDHFANAAAWCPIPFAHVNFNAPVEKIYDEVILALQKGLGNQPGPSSQRLS